MTFWTPSACDQCAENLLRTTGKRCNAWPILLQRLHIELLAEADSVHSENPLPPGCTPFVDMTSASLSLSVSSTACLKNSCGISSLDKTNISQNSLIHAPFLVNMLWLAGNINNFSKQLAGTANHLKQARLTLFA